MSVGQLSDEIQVTFDGATATGTTPVNSTPVDMAGYQGVIFIVSIGTAAADNSIKAQQDVVVGMASAADLLGTQVVSGTNTLLILEIRDSREQFLRCVVTRTTTTTVVGIVAIRYGARNRPTVLPATTSFESWSYLAEGTA